MNAIESNRTVRKHCYTSRTMETLLHFGMDGHAPIMTQRGPRPTVASLTKPVSLAMLIRRCVVEPLPPAPALLILDSSVSAGWEMMAAATPATTPAHGREGKYTTRKRAPTVG